MAAVETFGVNLDVLRQYMPGLPATLTANTFPSSTQLPAMVKREAGRWCARARQVGLLVDEVAVDSDSTGYQIMQECIARSVALQIIMARERTAPSVVDWWTTKAEDAFALMVEQPASNGDAQDTSADAAFLFDSHVTQAVEVRAAGLSQALPVRLANSGRL